MKGRASTTLIQKTIIRRRMMTMNLVYNADDTPKRITYLNIGDEVKIVTSFGDIIGEGVVEKFINNYAIVDGKKYWRRGIDGKHRYRYDYTIFLMTPEDAEKYRRK